MAIWISKEETDNSIYKIKILTKIFMQRWNSYEDAYQERMKKIEKRINQLGTVK